MSVEIPLNVAHFYNSGEIHILDRFFTIGNIPSELKQEGTRWDVSIRNVTVAADVSVSTVDRPEADYNSFQCIIDAGLNGDLDTGDGWYGTDGTAEWDRSSGLAILRTRLRQEKPPKVKPPDSNEQVMLTQSGRSTISNVSHMTASMCIRFDFHNMGPAQTEARRLNNAYEHLRYLSYQLVFKQTDYVETPADTVATTREVYVTNTDAAPVSMSLDGAIAFPSTRVIH